MSNEYSKYPYQILGLNDANESVKLRADTLTKSLKSISTDHSNTHQGKIFSISGIYSDIADSASVNYAFKTPTVASGKIIHLKYVDFVSTNSKVRVDFYETDNAQLAGTDIVAYNHYRVGEVVPTAMQALKSGVTFEGTGAIMLNWQYIPKNVQSMDMDWFVLKPNTWYCVLFSNQSGAEMDLSFYQYWTEE
jgi:hypothetical protein